MYNRWRRVAQVNGVEMCGKSQEDVVSYLRSIKFGSVVNLIISRTDTQSSVSRAPPTSIAVISLKLCAQLK